MTWFVHGISIMSHGLVTSPNAAEANESRRLVGTKNGRRSFILLHSTPVLAGRRSF
jgi:hypothetical protein